MYQVGYFTGVVHQEFCPIIAFDQEETARQYVEIAFLLDSMGLEQNVAIRHENKIIFDGRWVRLS